ncbi:MAG: hypothetical protein KQJ78_13730 [Deltaproteobacteria bacterium]|nr:hypothetical protein [Deltaproteobacteria bacterium]
MSASTAKIAKSGKSGSDKPRLKELREARASLISQAQERMKSQNQEVGLLRKALAESALTVPELAGQTGLSGERVLYYVSSLMKYGELKEETLDGHYYRYALVPKEKPRKKSQTEGC